MFHRDFEQMSERYRFPRGLSGKGESIGILTFGGAVSPSDLARYFHQQIGRVPIFDSNRSAQTTYPTKTRATIRKSHSIFSWPEDWHRAHSL